MDTRSIYTGTQGAVRDTNKVLRNTYMLLSLTLGFSAVVAGVATVMNMPPPALGHLPGRCLRTDVPDREEP